MMRSIVFFLLALVALLIPAKSFSIHKHQHGASPTRILRDGVKTTCGDESFASPLAIINSPTRTSKSSLTILFGKKANRQIAAEKKKAEKPVRARKKKDDVIEVEAVVLESLPNAMFRCALDGALETQDPVLATVSGKIRKNLVKILVGDKVTIELSPYDLTRGRITYRHR